MYVRERGEFTNRVCKEGKKEGGLIKVFVNKVELNICTVWQG